MTTYGRNQRLKLLRIAKREMLRRRFRPNYTGGRFSKARAGELKFNDTAMSDATVASVMTFYNPTVIVQGDTEIQRIGRKVTLKSIAVKGTVTLTAQTSAADASCMVRMKIIQDSQTNGAAFAATDLLETDVIHSFNNLANSSRFRVLKQKTFQMRNNGMVASGAAFTTGEDVRKIDCYLPLNIPIEYDNSVSTGAIASVRSNSLWVVFQTSNGEIIALDGNIRIRFTDG